MSEVSNLLSLIPLVVSILSIVIATLGWQSQRKENTLLQNQIDQQAEEIRLQGEQIKQQGRARFIEKYYPPLIQNLKGSVNSVKEEFEGRNVGRFDKHFGELLKRNAEGTLGMIKPLSDKIHTGLKKVTDDHLPMLNYIQEARQASFNEIPKKWMLFLIENSDRFRINLSPQDFVAQCHFIWDLWCKQYGEAKKGFDEVCNRSLNSEDDSVLLRERIFGEMSDIADFEWTPIRQRFKALHDEMRDWMSTQAIQPMERSLAEITEELRAS